MRYVRRRRLRGLALKRFTVVLSEECYAHLLEMKGALGNSAAIERLILEKKKRRERKLAQRTPV